MCDHKETKISRERKDLAGLTFEYEAYKCLACGSVLWTEETEKNFRAWLGQQRKRHPDRFVVQKVTLPEKLVTFAKELAEKHHRTESDVYQACLALYFVHAKKQGFQGELDRFEVDQTSLVAKKFRVNPAMFVRLEANGKLFDLPMNAVAAWAIGKVLAAASAEKDPKTLNSIEFALEAA